MADEVTTFIELANDMIINDQFDYLADVLKDLKNYQSFNHELKLRVLPDIKIYDDLVLFQLKISRFLKNNEFEDMSYVLEYIKRAKVQNHDKSEFQPHIWISVRRKTDSWFCYGKKCLEKGKKLKASKLITLDACKEHKYCKKCLRHHVLERIQSNGLFEVRCEACLKIKLCTISNVETETGSSSETGLKVFTSIDLNHALFQSDLTEYYSKKQGNEFKQVCLFVDCPRKRKPTNVAFFKKFKCDEQFCDMCYAKSTINYINAFKNSFNLQNIGNLVGIMCPNQHIRSAETLSPKEVRAIIMRSKTKLPENKIEELLETYQKIKPLFERKTEEFCGRCKTHSMIYSLSNYCTRCFWCFLCRGEYHRNGECNQKFNIEDKVAFENKPIPYPGVEGYNICIECIELIPSDYKIEKFDHIKFLDKETKMHEKLKMFHHNANTCYFIAQTNVHMEMAKTEAIRINNEYKINSEIIAFSLIEKNLYYNDGEFTGEKLHFILYECIYQELYKDLQEQPISHENKYNLIFYKKEKIYTNRYMIIPIRLVTIQKVFRPAPAAINESKTKTKKKR